MALNITVLGLGPIGSALGLALGTLDPKVLDVGRPVIVGWDRDKRAMADARGRLAADRVEADLVAAVRDADVVIVTVPHADMRDTLSTIAPALKPGTIVTDTASSKADVLEWARTLLPETVEFVGGHPLAGIESGGRELRADIFHDTIYCLAPLPRTRRSALDGVEALVTAIGAKPYYIDAAEHDSYAAAAGHLPLAVAVALMETLSRSGGWREIQAIAGPALLGMTELSAGGSEESTDALVSNTAALEGWLDRMIGTLVEIRRNVRDPVALQAVLEHARDARDSWIRSRPHMRPGEEEFQSNVAEVERPNLSGLFFGRRTMRDKRR